MCISGYIFAKTPCESLVIKWQELLDDYDLPFFHMVECAPCKGVYAHLDMTQCDSAARRAYSLIREYMTIGFSVSLELRHENLIPKRNIYKSAYTFLCWQALQMIRKWANGQNYTGQIAYIL